MRRSSPALIRWLALALIVAGLLAYANSLPAPFVLDDEDAIVRNPYITSLTPLSSAMAAPAESSFAGRPVAALSLAVSYAMGGLSPASFRMLNVAVLIASALVLFGIVRRTIRRGGGPLAESADWLALATAGIWLVHPLNSEVVGYITQRTESLMGLCYLVALYATVRAIDAPADARRWTVAAIVAGAAGMACKESMVTAPLMVLLYDVVFGAGSLREALRRRGFLHGGLAATWLVLLWLNIDAPRSGSAGFATAVSPWTYLLHQGEMIVTYLKLSVWPHPLVLDYGRTTPIEITQALPGLLVVIALVAGTAAAWIRGHRVVAFLAGWFLITLAPTSSFVPIATEVGAERRMFLPLIALVLLLVLGMRRASRHWPVLAAATALSLMAATIVRNAEYLNPITIWQTVVERRPHGRAHYNLALALSASGRSEQATAHYRDALPGEPAAHYGLGFEASRAGRLDEAVNELQEFLRLRPADAMAPQAGLLLGELLMRLHRPADAERAFRTVLEQAPGLADASGKLADLLFGQVRYGEAIPHYRQYVAAMPAVANARHSLGLALAATQQEAAAAIEFEQAVALGPADAQFRMSLGTALAATGRLAPAIVQYREALRLSPADARIMSALALALADSGARDESLALFRRALILAPNDLSIQSDFTTALGLIQR